MQALLDMAPGLIQRMQSPYGQHAPFDPSYMRGGPYNQGVFLTPTETNWDQFYSGMVPQGTPQPGYQAAPPGLAERSALQHMIEAPGNGGQGMVGAGAQGGGMMQPQPMPQRGGPQMPAMNMPMPQMPNAPDQSQLLMYLAQMLGAR